MMTSRAELNKGGKERLSCPNYVEHTSGPEGLLAWLDWAERKAKTHDQFLCPGCGLWSIWRRKEKKPHESR